MMGGENQAFNRRVDEGVLLRELIENRNKAHFSQETTLLTLINSIQEKLFLGKDGRLGGIIEDWLSTGLEINVEEDKAIGAQITNGIFYVHSYLSSARVPIYFGNYYQNREKKEEEDEANYNLWKRVPQEVVDSNNGKVKYYHILNFLVSEFDSGIKQRYLLVNFYPKIIELEPEDNSSDIALDVINIPTDDQLTAKLQFLKKTDITWKNKCKEFLDVFNDEDQRSSFGEIRDLIDLWEEIYTYKLDDPGLMFANIFKYRMKLDNELKSNWPVVLYVPCASLHKRRPGLVCNLKLDSETKKIQLSRSDVLNLVKCLSERIALFSNMVHAIELAAYDRKGLLPYSINGKPYQTHWLTKFPTQCEAKKKSTLDIGPEYTTRSEMLESILLKRIKKSGDSGRAYEVVMELNTTMQELMSQDQIVYSSYDSIVSRVIECINKIAKILFHTDCNGSCVENEEICCPILNPLIRLIKTEGDLRFISTYREHFIHCFHVFFFGLVFLADILGNNELKLLGLDKKMSTLDFLKMWFVTAMFHDSAYAIQKMEDLAEDYFQRVLLHKAPASDSNSEGARSFYIDRSKLLINNDIYTFLLECKELNSLEENSHAVTRALVDKADHGILSSFALYNEISELLKKTPTSTNSEFMICTEAKACLETNWKNDGNRKKLEEICKAIALHHICDSHWKFDTSVVGEEEFKEIPDKILEASNGNALLMLLMLCDMVAQNGRTFKTQGQIRYELRLGNIDYDESSKVFQIDLVYSRPEGWDYQKENGSLESELVAKGGLAYDRIKEKGGWYERPKDIIEKYVKKQNEGEIKAKIRLRLLTANVYADDEDISTNGIILNEALTSFFYEIPLPV